jgi:hypothetical protein
LSSREAIVTKKNSKFAFKIKFSLPIGRRIQCSFRKYYFGISAIKIKPQNSKSNCQQKILFSRIVLSRVVRTLKIPLIDFKYRKYKVMSVLGKITSLQIFLKICVDHSRKGTPLTKCTTDQINKNWFFEIFVFFRFFSKYFFQNEVQK